MKWVRAAIMFAVLGTAVPATAQPRVVTLWASGRIARFDPVAHLLVIKQGTHEMTFTVRGETRLEQGVQTQPPAELTHDVGRDVRISYVLISGARIARRVVIVVISR
jgi:anti-sigma factor RsiW